MEVTNTSKDGHSGGGRGIRCQCESRQRHTIPIVATAAPCEIRCRNWRRAERRPVRQAWHGGTGTDSDVSARQNVSAAGGTLLVSNSQSGSGAKTIQVVIK